MHMSCSVRVARQPSDSRRAYWHSKSLHPPIDAEQMRTDSAFRKGMNEIEDADAAAGTKIDFYITLSVKMLERAQMTLAKSTM